MISKSRHTWVFYYLNSYFAWPLIGFHTDTYLGPSNISLFLALKWDLKGNYKYACF